MNTVRNTPRFSRRTYGLFLTTILLFGCSRGNTGAVIATPTSIPSTTTLALANATSTQFAHPTAPAAIAKAAAIAIQPVTVAIPNKMPIYVWVSKASYFGPESKVWTQ